MNGLTGGCLCGAVRYRLLGEPYDAGYCHCRVCQLWSGAPVMSFATVQKEAWKVETGAEDIARMRTTGFGERQFCRRCGSGLTIHIDFQPDEIDFAICTLDDPAAIQPGFHIFRASRVKWFETADNLPRHDRFRPDTRGLRGTEPPST